MIALHMVWKWIFYSVDLACTDMTKMHNLLCQKCYQSGTVCVAKMSKITLFLRKDFSQYFTLAEGLWSIPCLLTVTSKYKLFSCLICPFALLEKDTHNGHICNGDKIGWQGTYVMKMSIMAVIEYCELASNVDYLGVFLKKSQNADQTRNGL